MLLIRGTGSSLCVWRKISRLSTLSRGLCPRVTADRTEQSCFPSCAPQPIVSTSNWRWQTDLTSSVCRRQPGYCCHSHSLQASDYQWRGGRGSNSDQYGKKGTDGILEYTRLIWTDPHYYPSNSKHKQELWGCRALGQCRGCYLMEFLWGFRAASSSRDVPHETWAPRQLRMSAVKLGSVQVVIWEGGKNNKRPITYNISCLVTALIALTSF